MCPGWQDAVHNSKIDTWWTDLEPTSESPDTEESGVGHDIGCPFSGHGDIVDLKEVVL